MNTKIDPTGASQFVALEVALEVIRGLRRVVALIRRHSPRQAEQLIDAASSVPANVAEGNRRSGKDRLRFFRIAAGSADETRTHLRTALAWGWVTERDIEAPLRCLDRELRLLWGLTR